jgi:hypothetical protein
MTLWIQTYGYAEVQNGRFYFAQMEVCFHNMMIKKYFKGLIKFLKDVNNGTFKG